MHTIAEPVLAALALVVPSAACRGDVTSDASLSIDDNFEMYRNRAERAEQDAYRCVMSRVLPGPRAVTVDGRGGVIVASGPAYRGQPVEAVVQRLDTQGNSLWTFRPMEGESAIFADAAADAAGNVVVAGLSLDPGGPLLLKLDTEGRLSWSNVYRDAYDGGSFWRVVATRTGDLVIHGRGTIGSDSRHFVAKLDADGRCFWSKALGTGDQTFGIDVASDDDGDVIVAGGLAATFDFGGGPLSPARDPTEGPPWTDAFLVKYDASGNHVWSKHFGDGNQSFHAVAADASGNIVVYGRNDGTVDFGGGPLASSGGRRAVAASFDAQGSHRWSEDFAGFPLDDPRVAVDSSGRIPLAGTFSGTVDFGLGPLTSAGDTDVLVAQLDPAGSPISNARFGSAGADSLTAFAIDPKGTAVLAGHLGGAVDFGCGALDPEPGGDGFLAVLADPAQGRE